MKLIFLISGNKNKILGSQNFEEKDCHFVKLDEKELSKIFKLLALIEKYNPKELYFATLENQLQRFQFFVELFIYLSGVEKGGLIDELGDKKLFSTSRFLFKTIPNLIKELILSTYDVIKYTRIFRNDREKYEKLSKNKIDYNVKNRNEKVKILFFRAEYYGAVSSGGVASLYAGLTSALLKMGHECVFVSCGRLSLDPSIKTYFIPHSEKLKNLPEILNFSYNDLLEKELENIISIEKPDFIFQHHHDFNYVGSRLKHKLKIPFLMHADGVEYWVKKNWGKLYFPNMLKWAEEIQWLNSDSIFVPSEEVKKQILSFIDTSSDKIIVNPNSVDPDFFSPSVDGSKIRKELGIENNFVCGFVGTFGQWHGVDIIAKSISILKEKIPNIKFLLVGDGLLRPDVEKILRDENTQDYAILTGMVAYKQVPEYMAACNVLLTPCKDNSDNVNNTDNFEFFNSPIKLFEYMAMGIPIVATPVGQQGVYLKDKINGFLHEKANAESHAETIEFVFNNHELARQAALNSRKEIEEKHNWKVNIARILEQYYNLSNNITTNQK